MGSPKLNRKRGNDSEIFALLMSRAETESEHKKEELRLKAEQLAIQKQEMENQCLLITQQKQASNAMFENFQKQSALQQQQSEQMMMALMNSQQQRTQVSNALIEKLNKN